MNSFEILNKEKEERNKIQIKNKLENIKSNLILKKIFDELSKNNSLKIIKYNKKIQKRLNLSIKDYKEYNQIEIEIIPAKNKYGKFIHFWNLDESYYHIYFNDEKDEIYIDYINEVDHIQKIKVIISYEVKSFN